MMSFKEDDLRLYVIEREQYHLVPVSLLYPRPSASVNLPEVKVSELHTMKTQEMKQAEIEKLWKGTISVIDDLPPESR